MVGASAAAGAWRKRVGVEPTKDRLTAPPGFEVRTHHRMRISSKLCIPKDLASFSSPNWPLNRPSRGDLGAISLRNCPCQGGEHHRGGVIGRFRSLRIGLQ